MIKNPPVIFLDFDGVINDWAASSAETEYFDAWRDDRAERPWNLLLPRLVAKVEHLCSVTNAVVVVSSTWRTLYHWTEVVDFLRRQGLTAPLVSATPQMWRGHRGREISAWLDVNPGTMNYVVLDDDRDAGGIPDPTRLVRTDPAKGITDADVERAIEILRRGI